MEPRANGIMVSSGVVEVSWERMLKYRGVTRECIPCFGLKSKSPLRLKRVGIREDTGCGQVVKRGVNRMMVSLIVGGGCIEGEYECIFGPRINGRMVSLIVDGSASV